VAAVPSMRWEQPRSHGSTASQSADAPWRSRGITGMRRVYRLRRSPSGSAARRQRSRATSTTRLMLTKDPAGSWRPRQEVASSGVTCVPRYQDGELRRIFLCSGRLSSTAGRLGVSTPTSRPTSVAVSDAKAERTAHRVSNRRCLTEPWSVSCSTATAEFARAARRRWLRLTPIPDLDQRVEAGDRAAVLIGWLRLAASYASGRRRGCAQLATVRAHLGAVAHGVLADGLVVVPGTPDWRTPVARGAGSRMALLTRRLRCLNPPRHKGGASSARGEGADDGL
jgi:hypothetical protein